MTAGVAIAVSPSVGAHSRERSRSQAQTEESHPLGPGEIARGKAVWRGPRDFRHALLDGGQSEAAEQGPLSLDGREDDVVGRHLDRSAPLEGSSHPQRPGEEIPVRLERPLREEKAAPPEKGEDTGHLAIEIREVLEDVAQVEHVGERPLSSSSRASSTVATGSPVLREVSSATSRVSSIPRAFHPRAVASTKSSPPAQP